MSQLLTSLGQPAQVFTLGGFDCICPLKVSAGKRKRINARRIAAVYEDPSFVERAKHLDYANPTTANAEFSAMMLEYSLRYPDVIEMQILEILLEPPAGKTIREIYYDSDCSEEEVQRVLDFFTLTAPDKTEE
jgi:hypothetical protein